jgi:hypothetical protein
MPQQPKNVGPELYPDMIREDGTAKGNGFLGELQRPDGTVSSEISIPLWEKGEPGQKGYAKSKEEMPLMVPTLSDPEVQYLLKTPMDKYDWKTPIMRSIWQKATAHAMARLAAGKSTFAEQWESPITKPQGPQPLLPTAGTHSLLDMLKGGQ